MERIQIEELLFVRYENPNTDLVGSRVSVQIEPGPRATAKKRYGTIIGGYDVEEGQVCVLWDDEVTEES
jgi:hypothetical protein